MMINMILPGIFTSETFMEVETEDPWAAKGVIIVEHSEVNFWIRNELFELNPIPREGILQRLEAHFVPRRDIAPLRGTDVVPDSN